VSLSYYRKRGYLPEAILNFLLFIGWNPGTDKEFFTLPEMIEQFDLEKVQKGGGVFNVEKLDWINKHYLDALSPEKRFAYLDAYTPKEYDREMLRKIQPLLIDRIHAGAEIPELFDKGEFMFFFKKPSYGGVPIAWKNTSREEAAGHLKYALEALKTLPEGLYTAETVKDALWPYAEESGRGNVLWPLRVALSGAEKSPDPFTIAGILGKAETCARVAEALSFVAPL
jgi:glutamyl/glutaminyl-tRNA synthetase